MSNTKLFALFIFFVFTTGCDRHQVFHRQLMVFGTLVDISIVSNSQALAEKGFQQLQTDFQQMHQDWHAWEPGPVTRLNTACQQQSGPIKASELVSLIETSATLANKSEQYFNPAIGKLIALWGFHKDLPSSQSTPPEAAIKAIITAAPTLNDLHIDGDWITCTNPQIKLDFGAVAKGFALDIAAQKLIGIGLKNFIINTGGDLVAYGKHPGRPWRIGIRNPDGGNALGVIHPADGEAIFTSGDYERYYEHEGKRRHHIINPHTGYPSEGARAVTVIHQNPALADAAATALMVAGPNHWRKIADQLKVDNVMLMDNQGEIHLTTAMTKRIELTTPAKKP